MQEEKLCGTLEMKETIIVYGSQRFITRDFKDHSTLHICCNSVEIMQAEGFLTFRLLTKIHEVEIKLPHKYAPFFFIFINFKEFVYIHS